jgi:hypothetical protein
VGCELVVDRGGESGSEGLGGGAMVNVEDSERVDEGVVVEVVEVGDVVVVVDDVVDDEEGGEEIDVALLEIYPIVSGFAAAVPVAVVVLVSRKEGVQLSNSGWYNVAFADIDAGGVYSGLGFQSKE